ncbi:MAG: 2-oxoglutarate dehydrogenase E1 component [Bacteroidetes bacterium]|nr:2-oxoglutarate dehydrogenase E1 component [Bacteroidota bacterium]
MDRFSYLNNIDNSVIDELFDRFRKDPESVDESWRKFFEGFEFCMMNYQGDRKEEVIYPSEFKVLNLINGYRQRGHLFTRTNPVRTRRKYLPTLDLENFQLTKEDLQKKFHAGNEIGIGNATLSEIIDRLNQIYCQSIGLEYMDIQNPEMIDWLKNKMEQPGNNPEFDVSIREKIVNKLSEAVLFEKFIHKRFPGHKSFSLEGVESLIPAIDALIEKGADLGIGEFIIGMAHRGRLNVLGNIMNKPYEQIFSEFEEKEYEDESLLGDVKYHLGYSTQVITKSGKQVKLSLSPNPAHLEAVDPVVEGLTRARIDQVYAGDYGRIAPVLIHGDASIAGEGVVYEVVQMSNLEGYKTGGTIHLIVNNQLGFTTNYLDGRSSMYCTDVGKTVLSPVFHINADDVEAVVSTVQLAIEFRQAFHRDVFIDLLGYRKYGHNESDEPRFTQPVLYKIIENHPDPLEIYVEKLKQENILDKINLKDIKKRVTDHLENAFRIASGIEKTDINTFFPDPWKNIKKATPCDFDTSPETGVAENILREIGDRITALPPDKPFFRKIIKIQEDRKEMMTAGGKIDWAMAELLAFGTLLKEGSPIRFSGQDVQRGTFSQRHAALTVEDSEEKYIPLSTIDKNQARFMIYNSLLSEYGVLGFEYGYALATPFTLTIWEAQFGDFSNGGQVIIDQYLTSAEDKWKTMNGLVLLLPHGYEGQGPEHSSARIERFLSMCGNDNIQVVNCTTPANYFHALRRQLHRKFRKPLAIFTPKSLLRHPRCISSLADLSDGKFKEVIDDENTEPNKMKRIILCSGKVFYDLLEEKEKSSRTDTAIIRIEQLYPFPAAQISSILAKYTSAEHYEWIQEEPANMGPLKYMLNTFRDVPLSFTSRPLSGSTATGSVKLHKIQQRMLVTKAFGYCNCEEAHLSCRLHCAEKG